MKFLALDVETASSDLTSICQIGIAHFEFGRVVKEWKSLIDPQCAFDAIAVSKHGITASNVHGEPVFSEIVEEVRSQIQGNFVVTHTPVDKTAIRRSCDLYEIDPIDCRWLDSALAARRTWEDISKSGYGLANVCEKIGYEFHHHDALEDAKAAGEVFLATTRETQRSLSEWHEFLTAPKNPFSKWANKKVSREGNPEGPLFGETIVFTGELQIPRQEAADKAAEAGCNVGGGVTKKTTLLCVGDQDLKILVGHEKSSKHRKAETLIESGQNIRIIGESDFLAMIET